MMKTAKTIGLLLCIVLGTEAFGATRAETNKKIVRDFYDLAFTQRKPTEAAKKYLGTKYVQHNPYVADGPEAFSTYFEGYLKSHPRASVDVKRAVAEGDLVVLHLNFKGSDADRGKAVVDIFRVAGGKIVEHWDVTQDVPEKAVNPNTMF